MLNFILNRVQKSEILLNILTNKAMCENENIIFLVPEQSSFANEKKLLQKLGNKNFKKVKVISFSRLYDLISQIIKIPPLKQISEIKKVMLINLALQISEPKLELYKKSVGDTNTASLILDALMEFKSEKISAEMLEKIKNLTNKNILKQKISEIEIIKENYELITKGELNDTLDGLNLAEKIIKEKNVFKNYTVFVDEFTDFTAQQTAILELLTTQAKDMYIAFKMPCENSENPGHNLFYHTQKTVNTLKNLAKKNKIKTNFITAPENGLKPPKISEEIAFLEDNLFRPVKQKSEITPKNIKIYSAYTAFEECEYIARIIQKLITENKYKYSDFTVITRDMETYENAFKSIFKNYEIPYFLDSNEKIFNKNLIGLVLAALDCAESYYNSEDILRYLKTGLTNLSTEEIALIENYIFLWDIKGSDWLTDFSMHPEGFKETFNEENKKLLEKLNSLRKIIITPLKNLKSKIKNPSGVQFAKAIYSFLTEVNTPKNLQKYCLDLFNEGKIQLSEQTARLWDILMDILNEIATTFKFTNLPLKKYKEILKCSLEFADFSSIPQNTNSVTVGCINRMRIFDSKIVFIVGAEDGEFPKSPSESKIFTEPEISHILSLGIELKNSAQSFVQKEKYLAYLALTSATEKLFISWNSSGEKLPSEIIKEVIEIFPKTKILNKKIIPEEEMIWCEKSAFEWYAQNHKNQSSTVKCLEKYFLNKEKNKVLLIKKAAKNDPIHFENAQNAADLIGKNLKISASQIEKFYKCRFGYFCRYLLNLKNNTPAKFDSIAYGNIVHFILEKILKKFPQKKLATLSGEKIKAEIDLLTNEFINTKLGMLKNKSKRFLYTLEKTKKSVFYLINHFKEEFKQTSFLVSDLELEISNKSKVKPLIFSAKDGTKITVEGKIDRVDTFENSGECYLRVIDYKTGAQKFKLSDIIYGINMQMLIYLFSLQKNGEKKYGKVIPAGVLYFKALKPVGESLNQSEKEIEKAKAEIQKELQMNGLLLDNISIIKEMEPDGKGIFIPAKIKDDTLSSNSLANLQDMENIYTHIKKMIVNMAATLKSGDISESPVECGGKTSCDWCEYFPVCCYEKNEFTEIPTKCDNKKSLEIIANEGGESNNEQ